MEKERSGSRTVFPEFPWCYTEPTLEHPVEVRQVFKSGIGGHCQHRVFRSQQQAGGHGQPVGVQIFGKGCAEGLFEELHKVGLAEAAGFGHFLYGERFAVVPLDEL